MNRKQVATTVKKLLQMRGYDYVGSIYGDTQILTTDDRSIGRSMQEIVLDLQSYFGTDNTELRDNNYEPISINKLKSASRGQIVVTIIDCECEIIINFGEIGPKDWSSKVLFVNVD